MRKKAFRLMESGGKAGEAKLTEVAPSKQIWGLAKLYHEESKSPGQETKAVLFDPGNLSQSLMGLKTLRRFERQSGSNESLRIALLKQLLIEMRRSPNRRRKPRQHVNMPSRRNMLRTLHKQTLNRW